MSNIPPIIGNAGVLPAPRPPKRRRWPTVLLACVVFFAGMGFGSALTVIIVLRRVQYAVNHPEQVPPRLVNNLKRRLNLNESQTQAVQRILADRQKTMTATRAEELEKVRQEVSAVLRADQAPQFAPGTPAFEEIKLRLAPP